MILYLSYIYEESKHWPVKYTASAEWNRNFESAEKQRKFLEWKAKQDSLKPPEPIPTQHSTGNIAAKWNPGVNNDSPKESPRIEQRPVADVEGWKYALSGKGVNGGPPKTLLIFTITLKKDGKALTDAKKEDLAVLIDGKAKPPTVNVMGGDKGVWHVGFTPPDKGRLWLDFVFLGEFVGEPSSLIIGGNDDYPYTGKEREEWKSKQG